MTLDEVAAIADPAGSAERDVSRFGKRTAKMINECRRDVALAPADKKESVFREVATKLGQKVVDLWIDKPAMIDILQEIATAHGRFGLSREVSQQLIADVVQSVSIKPKEPLDQRVSNAAARHLIPHRASVLQGEGGMNGIIKVEFKAEPPLPLLRALPAPEAFPIAALGDVLGPAAAAIQDIVQSPWAMCCQSVLAAATLAVQGLANVELPIGQIKPISSFFLTVAATGERKSATDSFALRPARKYEEMLDEAYRAELHVYEIEKAAWDAARRKACNSHRGDYAAIKAALVRLGPEPAALLTPLVTCQEPTFEGLCRVFQEGQASIGIFATEGGQFIAGSAMSPENKLKTAAGLSCVWDGETIKRVRSGDGTIILQGRRLSMHLMVQPDLGGTMLGDPELADQGMLSRCLVVAPESQSGRRFQRERSPETGKDLMAYNRCLHDILRRPLPLAENTRNVLAPPILRLNAGATTLWLKFADDVEAQLGPGGALEPIVGLANKLPEHATRLAAVLTLVEEPAAVEITQEFMARGITLAEHYSSEALRLFQGAKVNRDLKLASLLLDWLRSRWDDQHVSLPDIYQCGPNAIRDRATALRLTHILETHGHLVKLPGVTLVKGERRRDAWLIVPEDRS